MDDLRGSRALRRRRLRAQRTGARVVAALAVAAGAAACTPPPPDPAATAPVVVFDIDGTLTDDELSETPHPGAAAAVTAYLDRGYEVVYVTARWDALFRSSTETWLASNGFPDQPLHMAPSLLVTDQSRVDFKTTELQSIEATSNQVTYAYGDSSTDFTAYANVGVPAQHVFALERASATECQPGTWAACLPDYVAHLPFIAAQPSV